MELVRGDKVRLRPGHRDLTEMTGWPQGPADKQHFSCLERLLFAREITIKTTGQDRPQVPVYPSKFSCQQFIKVLPEFIWQKLSMTGGNWTTVEEGEF